MPPEILAPGVPEAINHNQVQEEMPTPNVGTTLGNSIEAIEVIQALVMYNMKQFRLIAYSLTKYMKQSLTLRIEDMRTLIILTRLLLLFKVINLRFVNWKHNQLLREILCHLLRVVHMLKK